MSEATLLDASEYGPKFTEGELLAMLRARYTARAGNGPRWAFAAHVRDRAGFDATRTLDAIAMDTWPSSGLLLHGFEIKCSRSDWLRELAQPWKAAAFTCRVDRFWIVAPADVVKPDELPDAWGLIEVRGQRGLVQAIAAKQLDPLPLDRSFVAALFRAATHRTISAIADDVAFLRAAHPSFGPVADTLVDLAADESVSPEVYDRVCEAVFTVLTAWAMKGKEVRLDA